MNWIKWISIVHIKKIYIFNLKLINNKMNFKVFKQLRKYKENIFVIIFYIIYFSNINWKKTRKVLNKKCNISYKNLYLHTYIHFFLLLSYYISFYFFFLTIVFNFIEL